MTENRPAAQDHELMKMIRARVNQVPSIPMTQIASELGYDIDVLCEWIMAYREPRAPKANRMRSDRPITAGDRTVHDHWSLSHRAQRFRNWRRERDGASAALGTPKADA